MGEREREYQQNLQEMNGDQQHSHEYSPPSSIFTRTEISNKKCFPGVF